jgi:hypothetical protein
VALRAALGAFAVGIDYQALRFLLSARRNGVSFERSLMLGRQNYYFLSLKQAKRIFRQFPDSPPKGEIARMLGAHYIEPLLEYLGGRDVQSLDASRFENASILHDMNEPIPPNLRTRFTAVVDVGTLEHVFNYPQALKNAMEMVALDGHFLAVTPCNNFMAHGFYQFSPELFFRALGPEQGFTLRSVVVCETTPGAPWYECVDPQAIGARGELVNSRYTYLLIVARRDRVVEIFRKPPQQSDYSQIWSAAVSVEKASVGVKVQPHPIKAAVRSLLPTAVTRQIEMTFGSFRAVKSRIGETPTRFRQRHLGTLKNRLAFRRLIETNKRSTAESEGA